MKCFVALATLAFGFATAAFAADCPGGLRKINIGVAVSPPNVIHTAPYIAKALGYFAKRCVDANILQFEGGASAAALAAVSQGSAIGPLTEAAIAQGLKAKQIWLMAPRSPHDYFVAEGIKTAADLKGKRLSAAGGVGAFNWLMGRAVLKTAGLTVDDAKFISQGTAGRLPGLLTGQLDGVVLHPEDVFLAQQKKPGTHSLASIAELLPDLVFNAYGASDSFIAQNRDLLRDTIAAMIEANRAVYRERAKVLPIIVEATQKPQDAVEYALDTMTKRCSWAVNAGFDPARTAWSMQFAIDNGDVDAAKRLSFDRLVDLKLAQDAVAAAGGPTQINNCKD